MCTGKASNVVWPLEIPGALVSKSNFIFCSPVTGGKGEGALVNWPPTFLSTN